MGATVTLRTAQRNWTIPADAVRATIPWEEVGQKSLYSAATEYVGRTVTADSFFRGGSQMYRSTLQMIDHSIPIDSLLQNNLGWGEGAVMGAKLFLYGSGIVLAVAFLPSSILLGVMILGLGTATWKYGEGFYAFYRAGDPWAEQEAIQKGEAAFAEAVIGSALLTLSRGTPWLARTPWSPIPPAAADKIRMIAQGACLADDPYFLNSALQHRLETRDQRLETEDH